jgi:hypothetical protein
VNFRVRLLRVSVLLPVIGVLLLAAFSALPSGKAFACLPCNCKDLRSVNCFGPYALYTPTRSNGTCDIDIWVVQDGKGKRAILETAAEQAKLRDVTEEERYITVDTALEGYISLYKLYTGEYQINVGPDGEGKVYTINFTGCPADNVTEGTFMAGQ